MNLFGNPVIFIRLLYPSLNLPTLLYCRFTGTIAWKKVFYPICIRCFHVYMYPCLSIRQEKSNGFLNKKPAFFNIFFLPQKIYLCEQIYGRRKTTNHRGTLFTFSHATWRSKSLWCLVQEILSDTLCLCDKVCGIKRRRRDRAGCDAVAMGKPGNANFPSTRLSATNPN